MGSSRPRTPLRRTLGSERGSSRSCHPTALSDPLLSAPTPHAHPQSAAPPSPGKAPQELPPPHVINLSLSGGVPGDGFPPPPKPHSRGHRGSAPRCSLPFGAPRGDTQPMSPVGTPPTSSSPRRPQVYNSNEGPGWGTVGPERLCPTAGPVAARGTPHPPPGGFGVGLGDTRTHRQTDGRTAEGEGGG